MLLATSIATVDSPQNRVFALEHCLVADQSCSQIQALVAGAQLPVLPAHFDEVRNSWRPHRHSYVLINGGCALTSNLLC
tara:strand:- start:27 stop:263 length:237 start_codon:yes stop_codon:yes gene_type:complete